jgi:DNA-binding NarL/FixJ family response regulator
MSLQEVLAFVGEPPGVDRWLPVPARSTPVPASFPLRACATQADAASLVDCSLALTWQELMAGRHRVVDAFFDTQRCYLILAPTAADSDCEIVPKRRRILEALMRAEDQKNVAIAMKITASTVSTQARLALESLGVDGRPSRVHPLLMLAASAESSDPCLHAARLSFMSHEGKQLRVLSAPRPDQFLGGRIPRAELAVIGGLVEGRCYADIARERGTSVRTVANQIAAAFKRLRVSGRCSLVAHLFRQMCASGQVS